MSSKVAVVTGSNKGIGYAIVKGLCERFDGVVYLTARDEGRGKAAVSELNKLGLKPKFHQLDITNQESIDNFKDYLKKSYGGIDLLVNNAAIISLDEKAGSLAERAAETIKVNYFATLRLCDALFPLLRNNARVVNVSSSAGRLGVIPDAALREKLGNPSLTIPELNKLMEQFVSDAKSKTTLEKWGTQAYVHYAVSKVGLSAVSFIQQRLFDKEEPNRNISVNSVHPGYVDTDLSNHKGPLTIEEGAKAPLFLALDADLKGEYVWFDCRVVDWYKHPVENL